MGTDTRHIQGGIMMQCAQHPWLEEKLSAMDDKTSRTGIAVEEIHVALIGTLEKPGHIRKMENRLEKVEARQSMVTRILIWACGILGGGAAIVLGDYLITFLRR